MAERQDDIDAQDIAETFDEDNLDTDGRRLRFGDDELSADSLPDVFDATSAFGDEDDEDALIAEDLDDDEIIALSREEGDEDNFREKAEATVDEIEGPIGATALNADEDGDQGFERNVGEAASRGDDVALSYVGDVSGLAGAHSAAQRYESNRLDDDDIEELGYGEDGDAEGSVEAKSGEPAPSDVRRPSAPRSFAEDGADEPLGEGEDKAAPAAMGAPAKHLP